MVPNLDLHCLPFSLSILNIIQLGQNVNLGIFSPGHMENFTNSPYRFDDSFLLQHNKFLEIEIVMWVIHNRLKLRPITKVSGFDTSAQEM